jgi:transcriptional regulator with XRE-family HTH domain
MGVSKEDRQPYFDAIPCTRFVTYQADAVTSNQSGSPHQLLRAMRSRRQLAQEDIAANLQVSKAAVSQWERGDAWPSAHHLHALCYFLEAAPEEMLALSRGPARLGPGTHPSLESFEHHLENGARPLLRSTPNPLLDLEAISLESDATLLANRESVPGPGHEVLGEIRAMYSQARLMWGRPAEAKRVVRRALEVPTGKTPSCYYYRAKVIDAQCAFATGSTYGRRQISTLCALMQTIPRADRALSGSYRAWVAFTLADAAAKLNHESETFAYVDIAWEAAVVSGCGNAELYRWKAKLLNQFGRHREAHRLVEEGLERSKPTEHRVGLKIEAARASIGLGEMALAAEWLTLAERQSAERNLAVFSRELSRLRDSIS